MFLRSLTVALALAVVAIVGSGCTKAQARTPAALPVEPPPPLTTPDPPSRLKLPVPIDGPAPAATADKPSTSAPNRSKPPAPPSTATPPPVTTADPASPVIQVSADVEKSARERLSRAENDLRRVQPASLPNDAREQYLSAQRFVRMANQAIKAKNFLYAAYCADKAATLASLLVKAP